MKSLPRKNRFQRILGEAAPPRKPVKKVGFTLDELRALVEKAVMKAARGRCEFKFEFEFKTHCDPDARINPYTSVSLVRLRLGGGLASVAGLIEQELRDSLPKSVKFEVLAEVM